MCHLVMVNSYAVNRSTDLNQREVPDLCYRGLVVQTIV